MKKKLLEVIAILIASFFVSLWIYHMNILPEMRKANKPYIVFERDQPVEDERIKVNQTFPKGFSFFLRIKTKYHPDKNYYPLLDQVEEKIRFMLTKHGNLAMYWGSHEMTWGKNTYGFHPTSFKYDQWNDVGFVYNTADSRDILTTYMNGKVLWEKYLPQKSPFIGFISLLPVKLENEPGEPFIGESQNAIFLNRALSNREVNQYYINKNMNAQTGGLGLKVFILFIMLNVLFYLLITFSKKIFALKKKEAGVMREGLYKLGFLLMLNVLCFIIFNLGNTAARYFNSMPGFSDEGIYLFILNLLFFAVLFTFFLEKITGIEIGRCISLSVTILLFLAFTWMVCTLPRFEDFSPFSFNVLFALLFTLIAGSFDILKLIGKKEI